ncbi:MAG: helix-turn-helix domain-containing protein [Nevskia sp.]|nr:helix-turn-helix domain-containing protein [Nevskia sp.]
MPTGAPAVPVYKLFGEKDIWPTADPLHYETIAARSSLHGWTIAPHSHDNLLQLLLLEHGQAAMTVETVTEALPMPCIVLIPPRWVHGFSFAPGLVGHVVSVPQFLLGELLALSPELGNGLKSALCHPLDAGSVELAQLSGHFRRLGEEFAASRPGRASVLLAILTQVLVLLARLASARAGLAGHDRFRERVDRFQELVERHFRQWRPVRFYAAALGVSSVQLNACCRGKTGRSAQNLIHDRLLLEARRLLAYSDLDVNGICYALGFRDPAYFSRFFARGQGVTPSAFRKVHDRRA